MKNKLYRAWRILRWPLAMVFLVYAALVAYRIPAVAEKSRSDKAVAYIHAQKITLADVMGQNLPPVPDPTANGATLAGVDANHNGIRDDVELAIFKNYPSSARIRAAELQYAQALQLELTNVFDSNTLIAATQEESRASNCIAETAPKINETDSAVVTKEKFAVTDIQKKEVENLVFNTELRNTKWENNENYMTSFAIHPSTNCDLDRNSLPN